MSDHDILRFETLPARIDDVEALEELLSRPSQALIDDLARLEGDIIVLGVGGKVGPTLARLAKRAAPDKKVIGVARFSDPDVRRRLESWGVETLACDLLDRTQVEALPDVANVVYMAGKKFGTAADQPFAWAMNTQVPGMVGERYKASRIVVFSTLCVYPFGPVASGGWDEGVEPMPLGDYANSCVGRERAFQYHSKVHGTPGRIMRLNYAIDMRYGVLHDIASWVKNRQPVPLASGHASVIWQGDSSAQILRSLLHCTSPTTPLNIGGPELASVRMLASEFGRRFGIEPSFEGTEAADGWVNNSLAAQRLFGNPVVPLGTMIDWVADWVLRDMPMHGKPTRFEVRDGSF
ncbi:MAG: NAD(P)-dependent oxidoreductase [Alphaproteobacteria bacterium]